MTMDPRFGELSRAMRNRAVEICLLEQGSGSAVAHQVTRGTLEYPLDSTMYRFRNIQTHDDRLESDINTRLENLSFGDSSLLESFTTQAKGLMLDDRFINTDDKKLRAAQFMSNVWIPQAQSLQQETNTEVLAQLMPYHPLGNELALHRTDASKLQGLWMASMYELMQDVYSMQQSIQSLPAARFERRKEKQKLPAFLYAYWQALVKVVDGLWSAHHTGQHLDVSFLKPMRTLFWAFFALAEGSAFDRATFQTYDS
jgi:midasin